MKHVQVGKRGVVVLPSAIRKKYRIEEGSLLLIEETEDGLVLRRAIATPARHRSAEERAAFILNAAVDAEDYAHARNLVQDMGLDPDSIPHDTPEP